MRRFPLTQGPIAGAQVIMFPATNTRTQAIRAAMPKAAFGALVRLRSAASFQIIELMTAAAKGARINNFICGRSLNDPDVANGAARSQPQLAVPKFADHSASDGRRVRAA